MKLTKKEAIETLRDFFNNPDEYLNNLPHIPLRLFDAIETAIAEMQDEEVAE